MRADPRRRGRGDAGMTMVELITTMGLMSIFMAMAGASLINMTRSARATDARSYATAATRQALESVALHLRAANPIDQQPDVSQYDTSMSFSVFRCTPTCGYRQYAYRVANNRLEVNIDNVTSPPAAASTCSSVEPVTNRCFRPLLAPSNQVAGIPYAQQQLAVVNTVSQPVFTYFRRAGTPNPMLTRPVGASPAFAPSRFQDCTNRVKIRLRVIVQAGNTRTPLDLSTTVAMRNFNEVQGCDSSG